MRPGTPVLGIRTLVLVALLAGLLGPWQPAAAQFNVGDHVLLVERDIHIPAHPGPGDGAVPFRFLGGTIAEILSIDPETRWIELRGEKEGGEPGVGWIVSRYIDRLAEDEPPEEELPLELSWCLDKGSPNPHPGGRLRIATWNLGNLHSQDGMSTFTGWDPSVQRFSVDYLRLRCYVRLFDPDILAVQEVDGEEALRRVVDTDVYDVHVSSRPTAPGLGGKQNTGFAYKNGLNVQIRPDVTDLDVSGGSLRHGTRIDVTHRGRTFKLMSVHLKSGCFEGESGSACDRLFTQVPELEEWIDEAAADTEPFIVLGDFNRRLNLPNDLVWTNLDDAQPPNADLTKITENMPFSCRDNEFTRFIDHIVFDRRAVEFVDRTSFRHVTYRQADKPVWDRISDHCPVMVEMWIPATP